MAPVSYTVSQKRPLTGLPTQPVVYSQNSLLCRESRASLLGHSVVLDQPELPKLQVCLYQRVKLFFSCLESETNCTVE